KQHTDFPVRATFFVLPNSSFGPPSSQAAKKMQKLFELGCEIGNHTVNHPKLSELTDTEVKREIAECVTRIRRLAPDAKVNTLALPLGLSPRNRALLASGE